MPHKRNPAGCARALAAATRLPGLVAAFLTGMVQEHERAVGGWHAEWPTVAAVVQTTGAAVAAAAQVLEGLSVDPRPDAREHRGERRRRFFRTRGDAARAALSARPGGATGGEAAADAAAGPASRCQPHSARCPTSSARDGRRSRVD